MESDALHRRDAVNARYHWACVQAPYCKQPPDTEWQLQRIIATKMNCMTDEAGVRRRWWWEWVGRDGVGWGGWSRGEVGVGWAGWSEWGGVGWLGWMG